MKRRIALLSLVALVVGAAGGARADAELAETLRRVTEKSLAAYDRENAEEALAHVHTRSPEYERTRDALQQQFDAFDVRPELVSFSFIGHDDEFAIARVKLKTVDRSNNDFSSNVIDALTVFHQEDGVWKVWSDHILGVELVP